MKKSVTIWLSGRVQGVNFRYYTQKAAIEHNIHGCVRNLPDGRVLIEAEGEEEQLQAFIGWCNQGPLWARVDEAKVQQMPLRNFSGFQIRH